VDDDRAEESALADGAELRTDERRALRLLADGRWLAVELGPDGRRRAAVRLSAHPGDEVPVGRDVVARLLGSGLLRPGRRISAGELRLHLTPAGRAMAAQPAPRRDPATDAPGDPSHGAGRPPARLLVVDDDPAVRGALVGILEDEGYLVETASDGVAALAAVARARPSAVLLDGHMPMLDGRGFASALRGMGIRLPIIVMTAARDVRASCDALGGDACIAKPFRLDAVVDAVARVCPA
jgi:CheY-like chemotaxis protein